MRRTLAIARTDLRRAVRDRIVWAAVVLLGLLFLPSTASITASGHRSVGDLLLTLPLDLVTFEIVVVAAVGYDAVGGERATGTVRTVLGLSATRRELVLGKLLARGAVVALAITVVLAVANVFVARGYGDPYLVPFWVMSGWMIAYGLVWTAVTIGYSAAFASRYRTLAALVGTYAVFSPSVDVWSALVRPAFALAFTGSTATPAFDGFASAPLWLRVTDRLNPLMGFFRAMQWSVAAVGPGTPTEGVAVQFFGTAVFLSFGAAGLCFGVRRFDRADLGQSGGGSSATARLRRTLGGFTPDVSLGRWRARSASPFGRALTVARADLRHALQNWVVAGGIALFALLVIPQLWTSLRPSTVGTAPEQVLSASDAFALPILVLGVAVGYEAIVGERESGTLRLALGLGASRRDVLLGKLGARLTLAVVALVPPLLFAQALVLTRFGDPFPLATLAVAAWLLAYALAWTAFVVGVSAAVSTRYRTLAAVFCTYLAFGPDVGLWDPVVRPLVSLLFTGNAGTYEQYVYAADSGPAWFAYTDHCNPFVALQTLRDGFVVAVGHGTEFTSAPPALVAVSAVVISLFATVPLVLGARRFSRADL